MIGEGRDQGHSSLEWDCLAGKASEHKRLRWWVGELHSPKDYVEITKYVSGRHQRKMVFLRRQSGTEKCRLHPQTLRVVGRGQRILMLLTNGRLSYL